MSRPVAMVSRALEMSHNSSSISNNHLCNPFVVGPFVPLVLALAAEPTAVHDCQGLQTYPPIRPLLLAPHLHHPAVQVGPQWQSD